MQEGLVMTVIGPDRPGWVDLVAGVVVAHHGNWLESRMARLGGQFAGLLRITLDERHREPFIAAMLELKKQGLSVVVHRDPDVDAPRDEAVATLEIVGQDHSGIVSQISHALALHNVNVEELKTERGNAPMSGERMFSSQASLKIPAGCDVERLRADLERIAADLVVDLTFDESGAGAGVERSSHPSAA